MMVFTEEEPPKAEEIVKHLALIRFRQKRNFFMLVVGPPGSGKSYTALKFAETIEPDFSPKEQVIYQPWQFKEVFENLEKNKKKVLVFDEAHITMPSRRWFSFINLSINTIMSTFRQVKQLAVFFVSPNHNWIDKQVRGLFEYYCVVEKRLTESGTRVFCQLYQVGFNYWDLRDQTPFLKRVRFMWNGRVYRCGPMDIEPPSERVVKEYEEMSLQFKKNILLEEAQKLTGGEKDGKRRKQS